MKDLKYEINIIRRLIRTEEYCMWYCFIMEGIMKSSKYSIDKCKSEGCKKCNCNYMGENKQLVNRFR